MELTVETYINNVRAEHAYHEGEGDCSYAYWRTVHDEFFTRKYKERGKIFYSLIVKSN